MSNEPRKQPRALRAVRKIRRVFATKLFAVGVIVAAQAPYMMPAAHAEAAETHLGGCILLRPAQERPVNPYEVSDVLRTQEYPPFVKKLSVYGLTLVAGEEISDDFMRLVGKTIIEMFPQDSNLDMNRQAEVLANHHMYRAVIPVPKGEDFSFMEENPDDWSDLENGNSVCDVIMQDVPGQVMEVVEHILHYVTDIGLHYAYPAQWGISPDSALARGMQDAVDGGYYDISQYGDVHDMEVRNRVLMQEFAYWIISTAWNLQEPYGPKGEAEWQIVDRNDLRSKLPKINAMIERTIDRIMVAPSPETLADIADRKRWVVAAGEGEPIP